MTDEQMWQAIQIIAGVILTILSGRAVQLGVKNKTEREGNEVALQKQIDDLQTQANLFETRYNTANENRLQLVDQVAELRGFKTGLESKVSELTAELRILTKDREKMQHDHDAYVFAQGEMKGKFDAEVAQLKERQRGDGEKIATLETQVRELQEDKRELERENKELLVYKANCAELTAENKRLKADLETCTAGRKQLEARVSALEATTLDSAA